MLSLLPAADRRLGPRTRFWALFSIGLVSLVFSILVAVLGARWAAHDARARDDGAILATGRLSSMPDGSRSLLGEEGAAWVGVLGSYEGRFGSERFAPLCAIGRVDDISLRPREGLSLHLSFVKGPSETGFSEIVSIGERSWGQGTTTLDFGPLYGEDAPSTIREVSGDKIPEAVRLACASYWPRLGDVMVYRERVLPVDAEVTVIGCKRGNELMPCGDGLDEVTTQSPEKLRSSVRDSLVWALVLGGLGSLGIFSWIGLSALAMVTRTRRSFS